MSFIGGIVKLGVAAGAAYSLKKISDKYNAIKPEAGASQEEKTEAYKQAAREYYNETAELLKEKAPGVKETVSEKARQAAEFAEEKFPEVSSFVQQGVDKAADFAEEKMPGVTEKARRGVEKAAEFAGENMPGVAEKLHRFVDVVSDKVSAFAESQSGKSAGSDFEAVVDADIESTEPDIEVTFEEIVADAEELADRVQKEI